MHGNANYHYSHGSITGDKGISIRNELAKTAMQSLLNNGSNRIYNLPLTDDECKMVARNAYKMADAMIDESNS